MFVEEVPSPWFLFGVLVLEVSNGSLWIVTFHYEALVASSDVVMERVFESKSVELVGALNLKDNCSNDGIEPGPGHWDDSGCVKQTWPDDILAEVLLETSFLNVPPDDFNVLTGHLVPDLNNVQTVVVIVVSLQSITSVMVEVGVVVLAEVVAWIDP